MNDPEIPGTYVFDLALSRRACRLNKMGHSLRRPDNRAAFLALMTRAGAEAVEVIMWLIMRGAMAPEVREVHRSYYAPMTTGMAVLALVDP